MDNILALESVVVERMSEVFRPYDITSTDGINARSALNLLSSLPGSFALRVLKTWLNGWATSHRMHEDPVLKCLLGCRDGRDSLSHYCMCPHMYALVNFLLEDTSEIPLQRIGLRYPSKKSLIDVACMFSAYHAVKSMVRAGKIPVHEDELPTSALKLAWSVFAETFVAEAGECGRVCASFSLAKFINFKMNGHRPVLSLPDHGSAAPSSSFLSSDPVLPST